MFNHKIGKQLIVNCEKLETSVALLSNGKLEEYLMERHSSDPMPGNIYLGKIVNLEPKLQAAFVDIGCEKNAFLHYSDMLTGADEALEKIIDSHPQPVADNSRRSRKKRGRSKTETLLDNAIKLRKRKLTVNDIPEVFKPGMELLVQVTKGPIGTKGARITTDISIAGRFLVLMPYADHLGLSTKIEGDAERARLRKVLESLERPEGMGLICRTVGEGRKSIYFKHDLDILLDYWEKVDEALDKNIVPALVYREPSLLERTVRDFMTEDIDEIVVDNLDAYDSVYAAIKKFGGRKQAAKVIRHKSAQHIFEAFQIKEQLNMVFQRKVPIAGGGYICIDETEALIAIDVNSGRSKAGSDQSELIFQTNCAAAEEIARQLRLRNVGGLVVLDFIDMKSMHHRDELYKLMKKLTKNDRAKTRVLPVSKLGLMEMTRQREHESIQDAVYVPCPYCRGSGLVKSAESMSVEIQRRLQGILRNKSYKKIPIRITMHPEVLQRLKNEDAMLLEALETEFKHELSFRADEELHIEEFHFYNAENGVELI
ncbi:MAG: Rne/Rng family ribonuclease [Lentisphaerae bacterium]|nr:Rne/Rng family ribonuclease [Lentisphaerota bacterium]